MYEALFKVSSGNVFVLLEIPQGATDTCKFSDFVGFIMSYRRLCGCLDSPLILLASFCVLAGTGNSTITLHYYILEQKLITVFSGGKMMLQ